MSKQILEKECKTKKRLGEPTPVGDIAKNLLQIIQEQAEQNAAS